MYIDVFCLFFPNNLCTLPKTIDLTDFSASERRFDVGTMLRVFELNVKNPVFAKQKNSSNAKGFFEELHLQFVLSNHTYAGFVYCVLLTMLCQINSQNLFDFGFRFKIVLL